MIIERSKNSASTTTTLRATYLGTSKTILTEELCKRHLRINRFCGKLVSLPINIKD